MTATLPPPVPAGVDLYVRDGSRFVRVADALTDTGPLPRIDRPSATELPPPPPPVVRVRRIAEGALFVSYENSTGAAIPAPICLHGHFARWAVTNCCKREGIAR